MNYTNVKRLPEAYVNAVINDGYDKGSSDITATGLIKPPQMTYLEHMFGDQVTVDVADRFHSVMGQLVHAVMERHVPANALSEVRFYAPYEGWRIGAQVDLLELNHGEYQYPVI